MIQWEEGDLVFRKGIGGKSATVTTNFTYGNGTTEEESSKYIKGEDGKWGRVVFGK